MVIPDVDMIPEIIEVFNEYASFSNLKLNLKKTVVIPTYHTDDLQKEKHRIARNRHDLKQLQWTYSAKHLGVYIGRGGESMAWDEALAKYKQRAIRWRQLSMGMLFDIRLYNVFVFSVLQFQCQFYNPTAEVLQEEQTALNKLLKGPASWIRTQDITNLKNHYGFANQPHSLKHTACAAKTRVAATELWLKENSQAIEQVQRLGSWEGPMSAKLVKWVRGGIFLAQRDAVAVCRKAGQVPHFLPKAHKDRKKLQKTMVANL